MAKAKKGKQKQVEEEEQRLQEQKQQQQILHEQKEQFQRPVEHEEEHETTERGPVNDAEVFSSQDGWDAGGEGGINDYESYASVNANQEENRTVEDWGLPHGHAIQPGTPSVIDLPINLPLVIPTVHPALPPAAQPRHDMAPSHQNAKNGKGAGGKKTTFGGHTSTASGGWGPEILNVRGHHKGSEGGWAQQKSQTSGWSQPDGGDNGWNQQKDDGWGNHKSSDSGWGQPKNGESSYGGRQRDKGAQQKGTQGWESWGKEASNPNAGWNPNDVGWDAESLSDASAEWEPIPAEALQPQQSEPGWKTWGEEARRLPKATSAGYDSIGTRSDLSSHQRAQIFNSLLNQPSKAQSAHSGQHVTQSKQPQKHQKPQDYGGKKGKRSKPQEEHDRQSQTRHSYRQSQQYDSWGNNDDWESEQQKDDRSQHNQGRHSNHQSQQYDNWGTNDGWGDIPEEEETQDEYDDSRRVHFSPKAPTLWGGNSKQDDTSYSMPSKTLAHAYKGTTTSINNSIPWNTMNAYTNVQFIESKRAALAPVQNALFGTNRLARDRIHWMFSPNKDERVASVLTWIQKMSYGLGTLGLHKFLQSRERGALIANAAFRTADHPNAPVFDWLTFDELQPSMDRILQESVAFYDPAVQTIMFVFLPSQSGNSVAIWRRKINVPNNMRLTLQGEISVAMSALRKESDYVVHVDELPSTIKDVPNLPGSAPLKKPKRKWWKLFKRGT